MKKNIKKIIPIIALVLVGTFGITLAYFRNTDSTFFDLFASNYDVEILQDADPGWGKRIITFKNKGSSPVYLRISYNEIWSKEVDGTEVIYNNLLNSDTAVVKDWTQDFLNDFELIDGWYYYKKELGANQSVTVLNNINIREYDSSWDYDYRNLDYELAWNYEAVQTNSNAVNKLWNINVNNEGNSVQWQYLEE